MKEVCTLMFLGINTWLDIKKKEISLVTVGLFAAFGIIWLWKNEGDWMEMGISLGIGILFLVFSLITRGGIGLGDAWILLALGMVLGTKEFLAMFCTGMMLAGVWSLISLVILKRSRHAEIPFVPFLLAGYIGGLTLW